MRASMSGIGRIDRYLIILAIISVLCLSVTIWGFSQDAVKQELFREADAGFKRAEEGGVAALSPKNFSEARKYYLEAKKEFNKGAKLEKIRDHLGRCLKSLDAAFAAAEVANAALADTIQVRREAMAFAAKTSQQSMYKKAEQEFGQAMARIEQDDLKKARSVAAKAAREYRKATVEVLQKVVLKNAENRLKRVKKDVPKDAYKAAETDLKNVGNFIKALQKGDFNIEKLTAEVDARIQKAFESSGIPGLS